MSEREDILKKYFSQTQQQQSMLSREDARSILDTAASGSEPKAHVPRIRSVVTTLSVSMVAVLALLFVFSDGESDSVALTSTDSVSEPIAAAAVEAESQTEGPIASSSSGTTDQSREVRIQPQAAETLSISENTLQTNHATTAVRDGITSSSVSSMIVPTTWPTITDDMIHAESRSIAQATAIHPANDIQTPDATPAMGYRLAVPHLTPLPETGLVSDGVIKTRLGTVSTPHYDDYNPMISTDGRTLYFISNREHGLGGHDFWKATKENRNDLSFSEPHNLGSGINTSRNEGAASMAGDGQTMYFTGCDRPGGLGECDIYEAELTEKGWVEVRNLREINSPYWEGHPTVSADGRAIYFVSNRPGSMGNRDDADIYVAYKQADGMWSTPQNLGRPVNTSDREDSPFIAPGGEALYFSSAGHDGYGKLDFFVSHRNEDGSWGKPENLGSEFNTPNDERFITLPAAEDIVYYASSDDNNDLDLYMARRQTRSSSVVINGSIAMEGREAPIGASLLFVDGMTGEILAGTTTNDETGEFSFVLGEHSSKRVIDVYGIGDSIGEFRSQIFLSGEGSYLEYRCDLMVEETSASSTDIAGNWNPSLSISNVGQQPDQLVVRNDQDSDEHLLVLDAWGHHIIDTRLPALSNQSIDLSDMPGGLYLVRTDSRSGLVTIRRPAATGTED